MMDKFNKLKYKLDVGYLESLNPENLSLSLTQNPYPQSQDKSWGIHDVVYSDNNLFICFSGKAVFTIDENEYMLSPGSVVLVEKGRPLNARHDSIDNFVALAQHFDLRVFGRLDFFSLINYRPRVQFSNQDFVDGLCKRYIAMYKRNEFPMKRFAVFNVILNEYIQDAYISDAESTEDSFSYIIDFAAFLEQHFDDYDVLEKAWKESPFDRSTTSRHFKKMMGLTPTRFCLRRRIHNAKELLVRNISVKETAYSSGFRDEYYFSRVFKRNEGISPLEFKLRHYSS